MKINIFMSRLNRRRKKGREKEWSECNWMIIFFYVYKIVIHKHHNSELKMVIKNYEEEEETLEDEVSGPLN